MAIEHAFVSAVLRYVSLFYGGPAGAGAAAAEIAQLEGVLETPDADAIHAGAAERRRYRRLAVDMPASARDADLQAPARVVDIGAGGLKLRNEGRLRMQTGDRLVVSLLPDDAPVRIDLPVEVMRAGADGMVGVRFCGRPLVLHRRLTPAERTGTRHGTAEMGALR